MWLEDSLTIKSKKDDSVIICVGDSVVKVDIQGKVLCKNCNDVINYRGFGTFYNVFSSFLTFPHYEDCLPLLIYFASNELISDMSSDSTN